MIDTISSVLPPQLRDKVASPPETPPTQFQVINLVSQLDLAGQNMTKILSQVQNTEEKKPASPEDYPEIGKYRGSSVNVTA